MENQIDTILSRLKELNKERAELVEQLRVWNEVKKQEIDTNKVKSFGSSFLDFDIRFVRDNKRIVQGKQETYQQTRDRLTEQYFTYVRLHNGTTIVLNPFIRRPLT